MFVSKLFFPPPSQGPGSSGIPGVGELCSIFFHFPFPPFLVFSCLRLGSRKGDREKTGPTTQGGAEVMGGGFSNPDQLGLVPWDNDDAGLTVPMWSVGLFVGATFNSTRLSFHVRTHSDKGKVSVSISEGRSHNFL